MRRDGIRIVEFDDGDGRHAVDRSARGKGMKIVEFDNDHQPGAGQGSGADRRSQPLGRAIKIKEFGTETEAGRRSGKGAGSKIKIMEFD